VAKIPAARRLTSYTGPVGNSPAWLYRAKPCELLYLSWGRRKYGKDPIIPALHEGWHYFVILTGTPTLLYGGKKIPGRPGLATISRPEYAVGHSDRPRRLCRMLTWIWRTPPAHSSLHPKPGRFLRFRLDPPTMRQVTRLHSQCRTALAQATEQSMLALHSVRLQLDLCLLGALEHRDQTIGRFRLDFAIEFLRNHLNDPTPIKALSDYLQISESSLKRLFREHTGKSSRAYITGWRMQWAREQLQAGKLTVKSAAYALGYLHPNDFSRAFKRFHGHTASRILKRG
jgi:AraC-like DNA-binding protein